MSIQFGCFSIDLGDLTTRLCSCIAPHISYVRKLKENLDALGTAKTGLTALKMQVKGRVDIAEVQMELERLPTVKEWLSSVEVMEAEVEALITEGYQCFQRGIENKCLGCCPSCNCLSRLSSRYNLGKKVADKKKEVTRLVGKGQFTEVAGRQILASGSTAERPSCEPVGLESAFKKAQSYIGNERVGIVGVYGMGGVGKSTLLTQINNKLGNNFDLVIWVLVTRNSKKGQDGVQDGIVNEPRKPTTVKIQDAIADMIGFNDDTWKNKSREQKATRIFGVLKTKSFLLLLDDIWKRIDMTKVGVPVPNKHNKSKIIFTTRSENVCGQMEAQELIKVECLEWEHAWDLFEEKVGKATLNSHPKILELAKILARECSGLPLALITIGRAMARKKTPEEWQYAVQVLGQNAANFDGMDKVLRILKYSYDNLQSDTERQCFLYCGLLPEGYLISKTELVEHWIVEGLLNNLHEGYNIIGELIHACLLEEKGDGVLMHDVISDMARWMLLLLTAR